MNSIEICSYLEKEVIKPNNCTGCGMCVALLGGVMVYKNGIQYDKCDLKKLNKSMMKKNIVIDLFINSGNASHSVLTSDLSHEYIHINSAYTT